MASFLFAACAPRGSGKTYAGKYVAKCARELVGGRIEVLSFAKLLKMVCFSMVDSWDVGIEPLSNEAKLVKVTYFPPVFMLMAQIRTALKFYADPDLCPGPRGQETIAMNIANTFVQRFCTKVEGSHPFFVGAADHYHVPKAPMTFGIMLQLVGTEVVRRTIDEMFWIREVVARAERALSQGSVVYIDDVRMENEAEAIRGIFAHSENLHGSLFRIRPFNPTITDDGRSALHASETEQDRIVCDAEIENHFDGHFGDKVYDHVHEIMNFALCTTLANLEGRIEKLELK